MGMRKRRDYRWETLLSAVQHKERVRRMTLSEAQQCYDGAMGELTPDEIELLAKIAAERLRGARQLAGWCGGAELVFSADAPAGGGGPDTLCEIVALHPRLLNERVRYRRRFAVGRRAAPSVVAWLEESGLGGRWCRSCGVRCLDRP